MGHGSSASEERLRRGSASGVLTVSDMGIDSWSKLTKKLAKVEKLRTMSLSANKLAGPMPSKFMELPLWRTLTFIDLSENRLRCVCALTAPTNPPLSSSHKCGVGADGAEPLAALPLQSINLSKNRLKALPALMGQRFPCLKKIICTNNDECLGVSGSLVDCLGEGSAVEVVDLSRCKLKTLVLVAPESRHEEPLPRFRELLLDGNCFAGAVTLGFAENHSGAPNKQSPSFPSLRRISLQSQVGGTPITEVSPFIFTACPALTALDLKGNANESEMRSTLQKSPVYRAWQERHVEVVNKKLDGGAEADLILSTMPKEACSGLWRSEDMAVLSLHMQREVAHDAVLKLGEIGMFQFIDLNEHASAFQRDFVQEIRRCDDMERKLRFLQDEIDKAGVAMIADGSAESETLSSLGQKVDDAYQEVSDLNDQYQALIEERNRSKEHLEILSRDFGNATGEGLMMITGVIPRDRIPVFERLVYRLTRGNSVLRTDDIETPFYSINANEAVYKSVFAIYFSAPRLNEKLVKICEANGATVYHYADSEQQLSSMHASLEQQVDTITRTLHQSAYRQRQVLLGIASSCYEWRRAVVTEKAVFSTMNLLSFSGSTAVARGWAPVRAHEDIRAAIAEAEYMSGAQVATIIEEVKTKESPPSYFKTNKITSSFQGIVDSYGMARYKEANPGVFTIITFPYLFGVMYGDIGHGLILTLFAAFLVFKEKSFEGQPLNEIFAMIFGGRYLLLLMGFFAVYMGLLYNDMFGFSVEIFASGYRWPQLPPEGPDGTVYPSNPNGRPSVKPEHTVVFGVDSAWAETENKLEFYNSIKMKCSVIIGVAQMMAGVFISLTNYLYFNDSIKVWFRFVPEVVFLSCTFGYMCLLIIIKWLTVWESTHDAPSLLETMTNFFLAPGSVSLPLFTGQAALQMVLLLISVACVPCMLCVIPYMEKKEHDEKVKERAMHPPAEGEEEEEDDFEFSEIVIHQIIHTIEYVLGCVSNTASYLRLWALSLAHSQLSEVFWSFAFLLTVGLDGGSGFLVFVGFAVWMAATLGVLLGMESLSAFLHALRLHWVEFNNKFYSADGRPFEPFDLAEALNRIR